MACSHIPCMLDGSATASEPVYAHGQVVYKWGIILTFILVPIWPLLALPARIFSKARLTLLPNKGHGTSPLPDPRDCMNRC